MPPNNEKLSKENNNRLFPLFLALREFFLFLGGSEFYLLLFLSSAFSYCCCGAGKNICGG